MKIATTTDSKTGQHRKALGVGKLDIK